MDGLDPLKQNRRTGSEPIHTNGTLLGPTLQDFWGWAYSDLISNADRGVLAEYLVAMALDAHHDVRVPWNAYDLSTAHGTLVEVKSTAYLQSWKQQRLSSPSFSIAESHGWDPLTNIYAPVRKRQAHVYVFALLAHKDPATIDPLNTSQWEFLVMPTPTINAKLSGQKTVSLSRLIKLGAARVAYGELLRAVETARNPNGDSLEPIR